MPFHRDLYVSFFLDFHSTTYSTCVAWEIMDHKVITQQGCTKGPYMMGTSCSKTIKNHQKP